MIPTVVTKIRWLKMTQIMNCSKNYNCKCADDLRKIMLKIPISKKDEFLIDLEIEKKEKKYTNCFQKNLS